MLLSFRSRCGGGGAWLSRLSRSSKNHKNHHVGSLVGRNHCSWFSSSTHHQFQESSNERRPFDRVLIANRGEISQRVMRTCHEMGIETVAIYTTTDSKAPFVEQATHSVCIGDSYLKTERIAEAIQLTQAQAVHPGYGFLSEDAGFCNLIENMPQVKWLGPSAQAIRDMGNKLRSKEIAVDAGVNVLSGHDGILDNVQQAIQVANEVGYPILLKAAAGGGGKGMRICHSDVEVKQNYSIATEEATKFFGYDGLLIEKFMEQPHHIEFQVLAGQNPSTQKLNVAIFCERECSIQRRNQKIIEESPSCLLTPETRTKMMDQVARLVHKVGYESAGTVEFLVNEDQSFYFLEMNTRLQVEHPVTEAISHNVDLVKGMLYVGAGWGLPPEFQQNSSNKDKNYEVMPHVGHAMEARIYAEDPLRGFLPSTGPLVPYQEPTTHVSSPENIDNDNVVVRVDSGVTAGFVVSTHYDPMLSKVISYSPKNRQEAIDGLVQALDEYVIFGVQHNARLCNDVLRHPAFIQGDTPTNFLPKHFPDGWKGVELSDIEKARLVVAANLVYQERQDTLSLPPLLSGDVVVKLGGMFGPAYRVQLQDKKESSWNVTKLDDLDDNRDSWLVHIHEPLAWKNSGLLATIGLDFEHQTTTLQVLGLDAMGNLQIQMRGAHLDVLVQSARECELSKHMKPPQQVDTSNLVLSPMPGTLISYAVEEGDVVEVGQEVCIVEAMKMQNVITAPRAGTIATHRVEVGSSLMADQVLVDLEPQGTM